MLTVFYLTQYLQNVIIFTWDQYKQLLVRWFPFFPFMLSLGNSAWLVYWQHISFRGVAVRDVQL